MKRMMLRVTMPVLVAAGSSLSAVSVAEAIPAFARQTGYSCGRCHTIPPRLTEVGTMFKMGGYTLTADEVRKIALDNGELGATPPLGARLLGSLFRKAERTASEMAPVSEARLYYGGQMTDQLGIFAQVNFRTDGTATTSWIRAAWATHLTPDLQVGIQGGRSSAAGGDPFDSLQRMMAWTEERNIVSSGVGSAGSGLVNMHSTGRGLTGHAFIRDALYVGVGLYDVERRASGPRMKDVFTRAAFLPRLGTSYTHIGGFYYRSDEFARSAQGLTGTSQGNRLGFDFGSQWPLTEKLWFDVIGLIVRAEDTPQVTGSAPVDIDHGGYQFATALVHDRRITAALGYGRYKYDGTDPFGGAAVAGKVSSNVNLNVSYMLRSNARFGIDLIRQMRGSERTNVLAVLYDIGF